MSQLNLMGKGARFALAHYKLIVLSVLLILALLTAFPLTGLTGLEEVLSGPSIEIAGPGSGGWDGGG